MEEQEKGFLDNFTLKMIAILTMVIDHVGYMLFPEMTILRAIGRISFPLFCFLIVEGFYHTRNTFNYLIRLSVFALISEIPFDLAFHGEPFNWQYQNVFFTLSLGLLCLFCLEEMNTHRKYIIPLVLIWVVAALIHCDYGLGGVLLICMFYVTRRTPWVRFFLCCVILYIFYGPIEAYGILAMLPITLYNGKHGPSTKMFFYWFYPVHLLILYGIAAYLR